MLGTPVQGVFHHTTSCSKGRSLLCESDVEGFKSSPVGSSTWRLEFIAWIEEPQDFRQSRLSTLSNGMPGAWHYDYGK